MREPVARMLLVAVFVATTALMLRALSPTPREGDVTPPAASSRGALAGPACSPAPLEHRAGQVLVMGLPGVAVATDPLVGEVLDAHAGGVLLTETNVSSGPQARRLIAAVRARARRPLIVAADEESGRVSAFRRVLGARPSARRLAKENSPVGVRRFALDMGTRLSALGVNVDLAPVADLDAGPARGVIGDRAFSDDPETVARYALAYARGLSAAGVRPTVKHFPGHGRTRVDTHVALPKVDVPLDDLVARDVRPFSALVGEGVPAVLVNHVAYTPLDALPASLSPSAYRLLRDMGFGGVAITDSVDMAAVQSRWSFPEAAVQAIRAGADGVLSADGRPTTVMRDALVRAVRSGQLDERRLDEAAGRMLALAGGDAFGFTCRRVELPALR